MADRWSSVSGESTGGPLLDTDVAETVAPDATAPLPQPDGSLVAGQVVDGMQVMRLLGRGGMGEVYLARDAALGRKVALKRLRSAVGRAVESLLSEARALARCNHPHIVTIYAVGEFFGTPYLALEYLEGEDLAQRLRRRPPTQGEALRWMAAIADAVAAAHGAGVLHRDLKPGNVMLPMDGRLRVVDFGLARSIEAERQARHARSVSGTPGYMAPEQWRGEPCSPATDTWAIGVMLYQMLTGRLPFSGANREALAAATTGPGSAPPVELSLDGVGLPPGLDELVACCLAKSAADRPGLDRVALTLQAMMHPELHARDDDEGPYRGLEPFTERHAALFFGRDAELAAACDRLESTPVMLVLGPSGAGKSSFVRAGIVPRLREQDRWVVLAVRPGPRPFAACAQALAETGRAMADPVALRDHPRALGQVLRTLARRVGHRVLLFVDQLEEAFALAEPGVADDFVEAICLAADDPVDPVRVVATVREAFVGRVAERSAGRRALRHLVVLRRPSRETLAEILNAPLALMGYRFEDEAMVDEMVDAVDDSPARLPLLEFAAARLWEARDRSQRRLTRAALVRLGGVEGVLARHADGVLSGLGDPRPARALCLRLVTAESTRRVVERATLLDGLGPVAVDALDRLIDARLVIARRIDGRIDVELAHESLITQWDRLRRWIEANRDELAAMAEVESAARLWQQRGRRLTELWGGDALREARWAMDRVAEPPAVVSAFVEAGEIRTGWLRRRRRWVFGGLLLLLTVVVVALAGLTRRAESARAEAQAQTRVAAQERAEARAQARLARSQEAAALRASARAAHGAGRPLEARARMRAALELEDHPSGRALWQLINESPLLWRQKTDAFIFGAAVSPDGRSVAIAAIDGVLRIFDMHDGSEQRFTGLGGSIIGLHWPAPDRLYVGSADGLRLVEPSVEAVTLSSGTAGALVSGITQLSDGALVFGLDRALVRCRWPCAAPAPLLELPMRALHTAASPAGDRAVVMTGGGFTRLVDPSGGPGVPIEGDAVSSRRDTLWMDDSTLLVARVPSSTSLSRLSVADGRSGTPRPVWPEATAEHAIVARRVACDVGCARLAAGDSRGRVWLGSPDGEPMRLGAHARHITGLAFTADGALLTASADGELRLWRLPPPPGDRRIEPINDTGPTGVTVGPSGRIATLSGRWVTLWSSQGRPRGRWLSDDRLTLWGTRPLPDGERLVAWTGQRWFVSEPGGERLVRGRLAAEGGPLTPPLTPLFMAFDALHLVDGAGAFVRRALVDDRGSPLKVGKLLANRGGAVLVGDGPRVGLWPSSGGAPLWMHTPSSADVTCGLLGVDGRAVVATSNRHDQGDLVVLDADSGAVERQLGPLDVGISGVARLGERLYALGSDGTLFNWTPDGDRLGVKAHRAVAYGLAAGADGRTLLTIADDGVPRAWDRDLRPLWRGVGVVVDPEDESGPWLASHRGWHGAEASPSWSAQPWARAIAEGHGAVVGADVVCVLAADGALLRLSRAGARPPARFESGHGLAGLDRPTLARSGETCLMRRGQQVWIWPPDAPSPRALGAALGLGAEHVAGALPPAVTGLAAGFGLIDGRRLLVLGPGGALRGESIAPPGVTALSRLATGDWILGFEDGRFERHRLDSGSLQRVDRLTGGVTSPVTAIAEAPLDTVVVGHANGSAALWNLADRQILRQSRLHGPVSHIARVGRRMVVASELGDHLEWSAGGLLDDHCDLMQAMWAETHAVWRDGGPLKTGPPSQHRCAGPAAP